MDGIERAAFSIGEFCRRNMISQSFYHKLQAQGLGPRVSRHGSRTLITPQAEADWHREGERRAATAETSEVERAA